MKKIINAGVMALIFNKHSEILLHHRTDNSKWSVPGGAVDFGENLYQAVVRECKEEVGFDVVPKRLVGIYSDPEHFMFYYPDGNQVHSIVSVFECVIIGGELQKKNEESKDARWFHVDNLPKSLWAMQRIVIKDSLLNQNSTLCK
jgi:8-oxo-dGTP pyrophosphatase MutT (NUDIX family)